MTAVAVKGNTVTLTLARAPGVSQMVTVDYTVPTSNPLRDLAGNEAGKLDESQKVKSVPTVSVGAVYPKVAPGLGDAEFRVTVSQAPASDLAVMLSFEQADEYIAETTATITIPAGRTSATRTFPIANDYTLASGALTAMIAGVGDGYALALAPGNAATVQVVVVNPPFIVKWDKDAYTVTEGEDVEATVTLRTAAGVPKPRNDYNVSVISLGDSAVAGDDYPDVSLTLAVQPADWKADGAGFAASVTVSVATVNDSVVEADERFHLAVASSIGQLPLGLECPAGLRNVGGATSCSTAVTIEDDDFGVTGVTVTSTPQKASDTYGARENIEFSVAFNQPVTVTGAPTFSFRFGTTTKTATWYAGSGTDTLLFSYAVAGGTAGDLDTDGIAWLSGSLGNASGIVQAHGTAVPSLAYAAQSTLSDHKVDGRTTPAATATVTVAVTSIPMLTASGSTTEDTYGRQETIEITVTASEAVEVVGDPVFRFTIGTELVRAAYDRMTSTATTLVFTYTVKAGDMAPDGIAIGDGSTTFELDSNDRIRTVAHRIDIDRSHTAPGTLSGHKVDGSRIADDRAPELAPDGAKVFTNELTLTYDEALDEDSAPAAGQFKVSLNGGTAEAVSAVAVDGSMATVTLTLATPAMFGDTVRLTYTVPATNPLQDLAGNPAGALTDYEVTNDTIVLPVVSISAVHPKAAPWLADAQFRLTASPAPASDLVVTLSFPPDDVYLSGPTQTVTIPAGQTSATETFPIAADYTLASGALTATVTGGERRYVPATAPGQRGDGAGGDGGPADRRAVGRGRLHGGRGRGRDGHADAEDGGGHAEAAGGVRRHGVHHEPYCGGRRRLHGGFRRADGAPGRLDGRRRRVRRVGSGNGRDGGRQHPGGRRAVPLAGFRQGRSGPARARVPRRAPGPGRRGEMRDRHRHRRRRDPVGDGGDGELDAGRGHDLSRGRGYRVHRGVHRFGDGDRHAGVRVHAG